MNRRRFFKHAVCILFLIFTMGQVWGRDFATNGNSGEWNNKNPWWGAGAFLQPADSYPKASDNAEITNGKTITIPQEFDAEIKKLTVNGGGTFNCAGTLTASVEVYISGEVNLTGTIISPQINLSDATYPGTLNIDNGGVFTLDDTVVVGAGSTIKAKSGGKIVLNAWPTPAPIFESGCIVEIGPSFPDSGLGGLNSALQAVKTDGGTIAELIISRPTPVAVDIDGNYSISKLTVNSTGVSLGNQNGISSIEVSGNGSLNVTQALSKTVTVNDGGSLNLSNGINGSPAINMQGGDLTLSGASTITDTQLNLTFGQNDITVIVDGPTVTLPASLTTSIPANVTVSDKTGTITNFSAVPFANKDLPTLVVDGSNSPYTLSTASSYKTITVEATGKLQIDATLEVYTFINKGTVTATGEVSVFGGFENSGTATVAKITISNPNHNGDENKYAVLTNKGTLTSSGDFDANKIINDTTGNITLSGTYSSGPFENNGTFTRKTSANGWSSGITNNGTIFYVGTINEPNGNHTNNALIVFDDTTKNTVYVESKSPANSPSKYTVPNNSNLKLNAVGNVQLVVDGATEISTLNLSKRGNNWGNNFKVEVVGKNASGDSLTIRGTGTAVDISRTAGGTVTGALEVSCPLTVTNNIYLHSGTNVIINSAVSVGEFATVATVSNADRDLGLTIGVTVNSGKNLSAKKLFVKNDKISATLTNNGTVEITNGGAFEVYDCTTAGNITFTAGGSLTANRLTGNTLTVNTTGAQTFTLNSNVTFADVILEGSSEKELSVDGTGDFLITDGSKSLADYVNFQSSAHPTIKKGGEDAGIVATNSSAPGNPQVFPAGWLDGNKFFVWKGTTDTTWTTATNWLRNNSPTGKTGIEKITIDTTGNNNPVISADVATKELEFKNSKSAKLSGSTLTVEKISGTGTLNLGSGTLQNGEAAGTEITVPETLGLKFGDASTETSTILGKFKIQKVVDSTGTLNAGDSTTTSEVNFATGSNVKLGSVVLSKSDSKISFVKNVTLSGSLSNSGATTFNGTFDSTGAVTNSGTITGEKTFTVGGAFSNSGTLTSKGAFTAKGDFTNASGGTVAGAGAFTFSGAFTDSGTWNGTGNFTFGAGTEKDISGVTTTVYPFTTVSGKAKFVTDFTIGGNGLWINGGAVNVDTGKTLTVNNNVSKASGTLSGSGTIKIKGNFSDTGTTSISEIIFFGDNAHAFSNVAGTQYKSIKLDSSISTSRNFTVNNNAKITLFTDESAESNVTFNGTATLGSLTVTNASIYTFKNDATIGSLTDGAGGSYDFKANATVNSAVTFSKTVTFGGNATFQTSTTPVALVDAIFSNTVTFTKDGASLTGKDVTFNANVTAKNLEATVTNLILNTKPDVPAAGGTPAVPAITFTATNLTLSGFGTTLKHGTTGSKISITGDVVSNTSLTVSDPLSVFGAVTINAGKTLTASGNSTITVSGMLTNSGTISSKSTITVNGDCTNNVGGTISDVDATNKGKLELGANFTDEGTTSIDEIIFLGNKDHTFTNNASNQYKSVTLDASISDAKTVSVVNDAKITTFTDNTAKANVKFSGTSTLGSISTASHTAGKYTFTGNSKVLADTTYNTDVEYNADALFQTDATSPVPVDAKFCKTVTFTKDGASLIGDEVVFEDSVSAGTINLSITASTLELNVGNTVTFASKTLTLTGSGTTLKHGTTGSKISITGSLVSDTSLTVSDPLSVSEAVTINAGKTLTANDTLETGTSLTNSGTFTGEKAITVGGDLTNGGTFTGKDTLSVGGALTNSGTLKGNSITVNGDCTNNANASLAPNDQALPSSLSFKANFTDNGTTNIDKLIFLGATHQFKPGTSTYTEIELTSPVTNLSVITAPLKATTFSDGSGSGTLSFDENVDFGTATFNKPSATFKKLSTVGTFNVNDAGSFTFTGDAFITNFTAVNGGTFGFFGKATITNFDDQKTGAYTFTKEAVITNLTDGEGGSYDFKDKAVVHSDVEFRSTVTFGSDAVFQDSATPPLPVDAKFCKTVTFTKDVGSLTAKDIIFESTAVMGADAASNNTITAKNLTINGDFTAQGKLNFTLDTSLTISGTGTNLSALAEWNLTSPKLTFSSAVININTPKLTLLGTDTTFTQSQSFTGAHKLTGELHVGLSGTFNLDAPFIAGGNVYLSSATSIASGAKLYCGADFRAKDITLGGDVAIRSNENWKDCFAEAVDCTISGSEVYWWDGNDILSAEKSGTKAVIPCENCTDGGSNLNWYFDDITFVKARTISDREIELTVTDKAKDFLLNSDNSISSFVKGQGKSHNGGYNNASNIKYTVTSVKEDSQNQSQAIITLKADKTWNTDATGTTTGNSLSTDADGASQYGKEKPVVSIERGDGGSTERYTITNKWGKRFASYDGSAANPVFDKATDGAAPVLLYVYTGQENHTRASSTVYPSYDAHNFLEFVYSEPVEVYKHSEIYAGGGTVPDISGATPVLAHDVAAENLSSVAQDLGSFENKSGDGVNIYGVAGFEKGHLVTKKHNAGGPDPTDNTLNSFYRKSTSDNGTSFRYAIAALCGPTPLTVGNELFQDYAGYIEEIASFGGAVSEPVAGTSCVIDLKGNASNLVRNGGVLVQAARSGGVGVDSFADETIGMWDVNGPDFVPVRKQTDDWDGLLDRTVNFEISGTAASQSSTLSGVEFHFFDNKPSYSSQDQAQWFLRTGWTDHKGNLKLGIDKYGKNASYAAEFFGGSRAFAQNDGARTSGGIRYSSLKKASENGVFTYKTLDGRGVLSQDERNFGKELTAGERALIFSSLDVNYTREVNYFDSPYFGINLPDQTSELRTTFEITYNQDKGVITDLAGNKLHCEGQKRSVRSIDMTPPQFNMTVAAVGSKKLFVMLTKKIQIDNLVLRDSANNVVPVSDSALDDMPKSLGFAKITDGQKPVLVTDISIDDTVPAKVLFAGENFTGLEFALNQEATFENMENLYLVVKRAPELVGVRDPVTGIVTVVSYIQDELGNFMTENQAHIFSDFAVNAVTPLYAYSEGEQYATAGESLFDNLYGDTNYSVHDFSKDQQNYGTMMTGGDMVVVAKVPSSFTSAKQLRLWASSAPENGSVSTELNKLAGTDLRVWLPGLFTPFAQKANTNSVSVGGAELNGSGLSGGVKNTIPSSAGFVDGDTVTFMYELMAPDGSTKKVCHQPKLNIDGTVTLSENGETLMAPLYALNLEDPSDILSLDLWSFKLKAVQSQRGGVSILNNVINSSLGEKTLVKVDVPNGGADVTVCVMTLDGNIIRYLHTGKETAGTHYYDWDGSNMNGKACSRGMYFVRVFGTGFDETRKVMVVK